MVRTNFSGREIASVLIDHGFVQSGRVGSHLKAFGTDEAAVDEAEITEYLRSHTDALDLAGEIDEWRDELVRYGLAELTGDSSDPNEYRRSTRSHTQGHRRGSETDLTA